MIILEKWERTKPLSAIYWAGEKELFYVKRFLVENPDKDENILTDHPKSYLETIFTDHRPMAEVVFVKERGKDRKDNLTVNLEEFISVKGISAMGNQLTRDKVNQINLLDPLSFDPPEEVHADELDVVDEQEISADKPIMKAIGVPQLASYLRKECTLSAAVEKAKAATGLESVLGRLMVISERYPELKSNQNFIRLQDELAGTENRVAVERRRYNEAVHKYNVSIRKIPGSMIASFAGLEERDVYFEATSEAATATVVDFQ